MIIFACIVCFSLGFIVCFYLRKDTYKEQYTDEKVKNDSLLNVNLSLEKEKASLIERNSNLEKELEGQHKRFTVEFKNLANEILEEKSKKFVEINEERVGNILNPLKEKIQSFEEKVEKTYLQEAIDKNSLKEQIKYFSEYAKKLSDDAENLTKALKGDKKSQGNWGEVQLEMILEKSGLQKDIHYIVQQSFKSEDGNRIIPDFIIKLPENKNIIIDSKVTLNSYSNYFNEENEDKKNQYLKEFLSDIKNHIDSLSRKEYHKIYEINQPDYVFMFIPIEPAFWLALKEDTSLMDNAINKKNIVLVSVTNLLATLRIISMVWKQEKQKNYVLEIAEEGGALYDKFVGFLKDMEKVGNSMVTAKNSYSDAMNKLYEGNGNIIKKTEKLKQLGAKASRQIDEKYLNRLEN